MPEARTDVLAEVVPLLTIEMTRSVARRLSPGLERCRPLDGARRRLILDLAIRTTGRIQALKLEPASLRTTPFGNCVVRQAFQWRFPPFSGERGDGKTAEVVNRSLPLLFE